MIVIMINHFYIKSHSMHLVPDCAIKDKMNKVVEMLDNSGLIPLKYNIVPHPLYRPIFPPSHKTYKKEITSIKKHQLSLKRRPVSTWVTPTLWIIWSIDNFWEIQITIYLLKLCIQSWFNIFKKSRKEWKSWLSYRKISQIKSVSYTHLTLPTIYSV